MASLKVRPKCVRACSLAVTLKLAAEARARADLAAHQDALAAAGWTPVPFPRDRSGSLSRLTGNGYQ